MKPGTKCETRGCPAIGGFPAVPPEQIVICKVARDAGPGWYIVRLINGGGRLCMHETSFRALEGENR